MAISTAPRLPKNGQARAMRISANTAQRWVDGWVRKSLAWLGTLGTRGALLQAAPIWLRNSCQKNMAMAQAPMVQSTAGLAPCTCRLIPTVVSFRPMTG